ncbi:MAG: hypothetical protein ONB05_00530, partial [candidate division KSB1 bacterium]|nr:hypothetical protein [candidate division KSB1 bacterium]
MKKLILVFGLIVSFLLEFELIIYAQQTLPEWLNYTRTSEQHLLVADNSYLWIGTEGGLIRLNLSTLAQQIYTRANSSITDNEILALARDQYNNIYVSTMDFFNASYRSRLFKFDGNAWMEIGIDKDLLNFT